MGGWVHFRKAPHDQTFRVNKITDSLGVFLFHGGNGPIGQRNPPVLIAQEVEGKGEPFAEFQVVGGSVAADAQHLGIAGGEFGQEVPETLAFHRSPRGVGLGIPPQHQVVAAKFCERQANPVLVEQGKRGCPRAIIQEGHGNKRGEGVKGHAGRGRIHIPDPARGAG